MQPIFGAIHFFKEMDSNLKHLSFGYAFIFKGSRKADRSDVRFSIIGRILIYECGNALYTTRIEISSVILLKKNHTSSEGRKTK